MMSFIRYVIVCLGIVVSSSSVLADPHWFQELYPYPFSPDSESNNKLFAKKLESYTQPITVTVSESRDEDDSNVVYLYFYVLNVENASDFMLDVSCPDRPVASIAYESATKLKIRSAEPKVTDLMMVNSDPISKNPVAEINKLNEIHWKLDAQADKQAMWLFSHMPPVERNYIVKTAPKDVKSEKSLDSSSASLVQATPVETGQIQAPGCNL